MSGNLEISTIWLATSALAVVFMVVYPVALGFLAHRRLGVRWKYFGYGALIFFLFQIISRVPLVQLLQYLLGPQLQSSRTFQYGWMAFLALTAGLAEEIGRYLGYRWWLGREEKTWSKAVMYGLGHGGLESMLLTGGLALIGLVNTIILTTVPLSSMGMSAEQQAQVVQQLKALSSLPQWFPLLGAWERLWTLPVQVSLSVVVAQVFRAGGRGGLRWLWLAVALHALVDFAAIGLLAVLPQLQVPQLTVYLIVEGVVMLFGLAAIWAIRALRDQPAPPTAEALMTLTGVDQTG